MTARRRNLLIVAALVVIMAGVVIWLGRGGGRMEVKLVFLGYTNDPSGEATAQLMATNCGDVTALLDSPSRRGRVHSLGPDMFLPVHFVLPPGSRLPIRLHRGESLPIVIASADIRKWRQSTYESWLTFIMVERHGLKDRLFGKASQTTNAMSLTLRDRLLSRPPATFAYAGPITNPPPDLTRASSPHRVARP